MELIRITLWLTLASGILGDTGVLKEVVEDSVHRFLASPAERGDAAHRILSHLPAEATHLLPLARTVTMDNQKPLNRVRLLETNKKLCYRFQRRTDFLGGP